MQQNKPSIYGQCNYLGAPSAPNFAPVSPAPSPGPTFTAAEVFFIMQIQYPVELDILQLKNINQLPAGLAASLTGLRCDIAALAGVRVADVVIRGSTARNRTADGRDYAVAVANSVVACHSVNVTAAAAAPASRRLATSGLAPWADFNVSVGVRGTASAASAVAKAIAAAGTTSLPRTLAAWAKAWNLTAAEFIFAYGSPFHVPLAGVSRNSTFTAEPASSGLSSSQQLGLGLGIALPLAAAIALAVVLGQRAAPPRAPPGRK
jgi:hypothetical protein